MPFSACTFLRSGLIHCQEIIWPKNGMLVHLKGQLSLLSLKFACLHTLNTLSKVSSWSLPCSSKLTIKMPSAILKTFGILLNSLPSCGTHHPLEQLQMAILYICTCQMDKTALLNMLTSLYNLRL